MRRLVNRHHSSKLLSFWENRAFAFWRQDPRWRISTILDFRVPIMGSSKSRCPTSYRSSIETTALNCLVFKQIAFFFAFWRQTNITNKQMDSIDALRRSCCRERRLNKKWNLQETELRGVDSCRHHYHCKMMDDKERRDNATIWNRQLVQTQYY